MIFKRIKQFHWKFLCIIVILKHAQAIHDSSEEAYCSDNGPMLQIAVVADQTSQEMVDYFKRASTVVKDIMKEFPDSKVALTSFGDYSWRQFHERSAIDHNLTEGCYTFHQKMTSHYSHFAKKVTEVPVIPSPDREDQTTALLFTLCDHRVKWTKKDSHLVRKVMILLTNDYATRPNRANNANKPKINCGETFISCDLLSVPEYEEVKRTLEEQDVTIFGVYFRNSDTTLHEQYPKWKFDEFFRGTKIQYEGMDDTGYNNDIFRNFVNFIKRTNTGYSRTCDDPDPYAYNILGL